LYKPDRRGWDDLGRLPMRGRADGIAVVGIDAPMPALA
jgi:hypothetical protein